MLKILVVDDSASIVFYVKQQLRNHLKMPFVVFEAHDGLEAYDLFKCESVDIVITDISMPNMDGYELISSIRQFSKVPIIAMSTCHFANQNSSDILSFASGLGADYTIDKSGGMSELAQIIDSIVLSQASTQRSDSARPSFR